jgi:hypothetical protein
MRICVKLIFYLHYFAIDGKSLFCADTGAGKAAGMDNPAMRGRAKLIIGVIFFIYIILPISMFLP